MTEILPVAVNGGTGRIGAPVTEILSAETPETRVVAINMHSERTPKEVAHLIMYEEPMHPQRAKHKVRPVGEDALAIDEEAPISLLRSPEPSQLSWGERGVRLVVDATGDLVSLDLLQPHLDVGAKRVIRTSPAKDGMQTIIVGVNDTDQALAQSDPIISTSSCTTNCVAPTVTALQRGLDQSDGPLKIEAVHAAITHAVTRSDRQFFAASSPHVPIMRKGSGLEREFEKFFPNVPLEVRTHRVGSQIGSVATLYIAISGGNLSPDNIAEMLEENGLSGDGIPVVSVREEVASSDEVLGDPHASVVSRKHISSTMMSGGCLVSLEAYYDNEWGYSEQVARLVTRLAAIS